MATDTIERTAKQLVLTVQEYSLFAHRAVMNLFRPPATGPTSSMQSDIIGVGSSTIVLLSGFFTGGVLALQSAATLSQFGATAVTGRFVSLTMIRELGPGAHRHHGRRPQCLLDGQRTGVDGGDRAD